MIVTRTTLSGAAIIDLERRGDARGDLARVFCEREFEQAGLPLRCADAVAMAPWSVREPAGTIELPPPEPV